MFFIFLLPFFVFEEHHLFFYSLSMKGGAVIPVSSNGW